MTKVGKIVIISILLLCQLSTYCQENQIWGIVMTTDSVPIPYASISLKPIATHKIISFTATDHQGNFALSRPVTDSLEQIELVVSHLTYGKKNVHLTTNKMVYDIVLGQQRQIIDSVYIKKYAKVSQKGDTVNFHVEGFSQNEDRNIGDVLRRMPGFDVGDNGEIRFNNRPISNFYLDGDDLLGGKYGIGTKTIPHDMVENVNVYTNHQHIKVNRDKFLSNDVAINLEIKKEARTRLNGMATAGAGLPGNYDSEVNAILLSKKFKMLNSMAGNNIGMDLTADITDFLAEGSNTGKIVNPSTVSPPATPKRRYLMNNSGRFSANNSHRFQSGLFLRTNINSVIQNRRLQFEARNNVFIQDDTISLQEYQRGGDLSRHIKAHVLGEINETKFYLKNDFRFDTERDRVHSDLANSDLSFDQLLTEKFHAISNHIHYIPSIKNKNTLSVDWVFSKKRTPQNLSFNPSVLFPTINEDPFYRILHQNTGLNILSNTLRANYRVRNTRIEQSYGFDVGHSSQDLKSKIGLVDSKEEYYSYRGGSSDNDLYLSEISTSLYSMYRYKILGSQFVITLPIRYSYFHYRERNMGEEQNDSFWLFEPSFSFDQQVNLQDEFKINYNLKNSINDIRTLFQGGIILNHRTIQQNSKYKLWNQINHSFQANYSIKRPLNMVFANIAANYNIIHSDVLNTTIIEDNVQKHLRISHQNKLISSGLYANLSKYVFLLASTVSIKAGWNAVKMENFYNSALYDLSSDNYSLSASLDYQLFKLVKVTQKVDFSHYISESQPQLGNVEAHVFKADQIKSSIFLTFPISKNVFLKANIESTHINQKSKPTLNYYFADLNLHWNIPAKSSEFEINVYNIFDTDHLSILSIHSNGFSESWYRINPRIAMLKYFFKF